MDRFQEPDCPPPTPEQREAANIDGWELRKAAERLVEKEELVEAFYQMGYSLHSERVLRDSDETEYEFKSGDRIIKVVCPAENQQDTMSPSSKRAWGLAQNSPLI